MQKRKNKENTDEKDEEKVCAFHLIVHGFNFDLVCFGTAISTLGLIRHRNATNNSVSMEINCSFFFFF